MTVAAPTVAEVERFRDLIALHLGLQFEDARLALLADLLWRRMEAGRCGGQRYLDGLELSPTREELTALAVELTVPETYFFRHLDQLRAFAEVVVPDRLKARAAERKLSFLSAGCASGEEPYTLAMILRDLPIPPGWDVSIQAVDMNQSVLDKAAAGRYSAWSLRETPPDLRNRWFRQAGRDVLLHESVRAQVNFAQCNLATDERALWRDNVYDAVFCRNVIMYFTPHAAHAVVERILRSLAPGGYLFMGHAETLRGISHQVHLCHTHHVFYYQRRGANEEAALPVHYQGAMQPAPPCEPAVAPGGCWIEEIGRASDRIRLLAGERERDGGAAVAPGSTAPSPAHNGHGARTDLHTPLELLRLERFGEALTTVRALPPEAAADPDVRLLEAVLLAHSGELGRAEAACLELLRRDELNAGAYYVLAMCSDGAGDGARAIEHDRVAAYLDPDFAMPRLHLGLLARRAGEHAEARRELSRALALLQREDAARVLFFGGGFNREALIAMCRAELVACGGQP